MPSLFCCCSFLAAFAQSDSVEVAGSIPSASRPTLPSSCGSDIMPTFPAYFRSNRMSTVCGGFLITDEL